MTSSCSNYWCKEYRENSCQRGLEHRVKLFEKRLDDNHIPKRSNTTKCELWLEPKESKDIYLIYVSGLWQKTTKQMYEDTYLPKKIKKG